jgi:hypothetical protein
VVSAVQQGMERRRRQSPEPQRHQDRLPSGNDPDPGGLTKILENYAQVVEEKDDKTGKKKRVQIFPAITSSMWCESCGPRDGQHGAGQRYLIQHSAGSGKSNSIAWLAHQLIGLKQGRTKRSSTRSSSSPTDVFSTANSRDDQGLCPGRSHRCGEGRRGHTPRRAAAKFIKDGKKIIISTVQTFPFMLDSIGSDIACGSSPSSSTKPIPARAARHRPPLSMALSEAGRNRITRRPRTRSTGSWKRESCCRTPATLPSRRRPRTRRWKSSASHTRKAAR